MAAAESEPAPGDLVTVPEAARQVGVSNDTVYRWVARGLLPAEVRLNSRCVSLAAARVLADATVHRPRSAPGPRAAPAEDDAVYVLPSEAAKQVGVPGWQVHNWLKQGRAACKPGLYGRLVRLADVQEMAQARQPNGS
jgi:predicted DNA-binding transcriptional regulator AlpA